MIRARRSTRSWSVPQTRVPESRAHGVSDRRLGGVRERGRSALPGRASVPMVCRQPSGTEARYIESCSVEYSLPPAPETGRAEGDGGCTYDEQPESELSVTRG
jgi:hypothetical protein